MPGIAFLPKQRFRVPPKNSDHEVHGNLASEGRQPCRLSPRSVGMRSPAQFLLLRAYISYISLYKLYKLIYKNIFSIREYILSKCIVYILGQDLEDLLDTEISFSGTSPSEY